MLDVTREKIAKVESKHGKGNGLYHLIGEALGKIKSF
jgi:hypothetical protein